MATYPSNILVKGNVVNGIDDVDQNDHNILKNEIIALQTYVGTNPQGSKATMTERMSLLIDTNGAIFTTSGGFPASTFEGRFVWRPDLITAYVYGNGAWNSLGQSLSNTIFSWNGHAHLSGTIVGVYTGGAYPPAAHTTAQSFISLENANVYGTVFNSKFKKLSGISSALYYLRMWSTANVGSTVTARVTIGSVVGSIVSNAGSSGGTNPAWYNGSLDLSGLANGTVYDLVVESKHSGAIGIIEAVQIIGA